MKNQSFTLRLLPVLLLAASLSLLAIPVEATPLAQMASRDGPPPTLIDYLRTEVRAADALRQQAALIDIIVLANCRASCAVDFQSIPDKMIRIENNLGMGPAVDLTGLVPDLTHVYRRARNEGSQLLALAALVGIGNEKSIEALIQNPIDGSDRVERATQRAVASFFFERYPELTEQAFRKGTFSLDEVEQVRNRRAKEARKMSSRG